MAHFKGPYFGQGIFPASVYNNNEDFIYSLLQYRGMCGNQVEYGRSVKVDYMRSDELGLEFYI